MMNNESLFIGALLLGALFYGVAEVFGRSKHIGKYWSWALLWGCFVIPGIIAIVLSPSAKKEPSKPNEFRVVFGILALIIAIMFIPSIMTKFNNLSSGIIDGQRLLLRMQISQMIGFFILGFYLINLGKGNIRNLSPKYYLERPKINSSSFFSVPNEILNIRYFISMNGEQHGPLSLEDIRKNFINPETLVWRHGFNNWKLAKDVKELEGFLNYQPPPLPHDLMTIELPLDNKVKITQFRHGSDSDNSEKSEKPEELLAQQGNINSTFIFIFIVFVILFIYSLGSTFGWF